MSEGTEWVDLDEVANIVHLANLNGNGTQPDDQPLDTWRPQDLTSLPEQPPTPPNLGNTHLVYPGKRHVFSGPPESAKTLAAYCILIQVVRNGGNAILIDFEMGAYDARQRLRELGATDTEIQGIGYVEPDERANVDRIAGLIDMRPQLVVIDAAAGIYSLEGLDDNKRGDVEKISNLYIRAFWRAAIATILLDHVVKDGEARGKFAIGSERKLGGADVHMGFDVISPISRGTSGKYKISTHKDRGGYLKRGHLADLNLESDPDTHQITWAFSQATTSTASGGYFRPTNLMEKVSKDLEARVEPVSRNTIFEALGGKKDYVLKAITALVTEEFVTETDGPNRSKLVTSARPYRENEPVDNPETDPRDAVVPKWFSSGTGTTSRDVVSGGSSLRTTYVETTEPLDAAETTKTSLGWFDDNGNLDVYVDSLEPDNLDTDPQT